MSTLTEKIAESIAASEFPNTSPYWTPREWAENAQDYMELARPIAAVVAEWLGTLPVIQITAAEILGRTAMVGAVEALASLAAEAAKGADQ